MDDETRELTASKKKRSGGVINMEKESDPKPVDEDAIELSFEDVCICVLRRYHQLHSVPYVEMCTVDNKLAAELVAKTGAKEWIKDDLETVYEASVQLRISLVKKEE